MKSTKAASRYAKALLELAIEQNKLDVVAADLKYLEAVNAETKEFTILLNSPIINSAKKIAIYRAPRNSVGGPRYPFGPISPFGGPLGTSPRGLWSGSTARPTPRRSSSA